MCSSVATTYEDMYPFLTSREIREYVIKMSKAIIISGSLAQDHEFIYPYYRLLEANFKIDVCMLEGTPVKAF